ncbi:hypothetical protein B0H17DRAFT_1133941 [Mycena rosella]|uniref:Uncharacterized protein n=1 Tax=Mycena rosella TaxID=1033263 RepID=A0AAD7DGZ6_MYCRO|nr:hypothetical protein B0H17DRAFT_1133941 [Mycena rosella]
MAEWLAECQKEAAVEGHGLEVDRGARVVHGRLPVTAGKSAYRATVLSQDAQGGQERTCGHGVGEDPAVLNGHPNLQLFSYQHTLEIGLKWARAYVENYDYKNSGIVEPAKHNHREKGARVHDKFWRAATRTHRTWLDTGQFWMAQFKVILPNWKGGGRRGNLPRPNTKTQP